jgi:hypothetical protein
MRKTLLLLIVLGVVGVWMSAAAFGAVTVTMNFNTVFPTYSTPPGGVPPYLTAVFHDEGTNQVKLTLTAGAGAGTLGSSPYDVDTVYLNFGQTWSLSHLNFSAPTLLSGYVYAPSISKSYNGYHADNDGYYDIMMDFSTYDGWAFQDTESLSWIITSDSGYNFSATSFDVLSGTGSGSEGNGLYYAAAYLDCTPTYVGCDTVGAPVPDGTPEPATIVVWSLLGMFSWVGARVWRQRRGPVGRQSWSPEARQAIHDIIARQA